jgi:hypothetical protein
MLKRIFVLVGVAACAASSGCSLAKSGTGDANGADGTDAGGSGPLLDGSASLPLDGAGSDEEAGSGCVGVPIVPDAQGSVVVGTNSVGIHGSWFVYSDCADLGGVDCATVTTPPANSFPNTGGKMCTSGMTSMATGAWGAGIALELNDGPPQQPFDTTAQGIKGFCFQLSGATIPSTTIRVAFPTKDNNDNAYFEPVTLLGQNTVLFSDPGFAQGSWVTDKMPFEPTLVTLIQFQIPSSPTAPVPWDFCIEGLTAVTQ